MIANQAWFGIQNWKNIPNFLYLVKIVNNFLWIQYVVNLKAFLSFNRMDVGWSHMFHVYFSSYFLQVKKKKRYIFVKIVIYLEIFYWQSITSDVSYPESQITYILNLTSFLLCLQCNPSIERFCWNINAENPSWFGKECPYCLPKGEWEEKFLKLFFCNM